MLPVPSLCQKLIVVRYVEERMHVLSVTPLGLARSASLALYSPLKDSSPRYCCSCGSPGGQSGEEDHLTAASESFLRHGPGGVSAMSWVTEAAR